MDDKTFPASCKEALKELKDCLKVLDSAGSMNGVAIVGGNIDYEPKDFVMGLIQATLAAYSIRITGVSVALSDDGGSNLAITYEYKWVPTDGSKAIPRWDTGVVVTNSLSDLSIGEAYVRIFMIVAAARDNIRAMPKQSVDL